MSLPSLAVHQICLGKELAIVNLEMEGGRRRRKTRTRKHKRRHRKTRRSRK